MPPRFPFATRPIPLWLFLTLVVTGILALVTLRFGVYTANEQSRFRGQEIQRDAQLMAHSIASSAAADLLESNLDRLEALLVRQVVLGENREMLIADMHGRVITHVRRDPGLPPQPVFIADERIDLSTNNVSTEKQYRYLAPIEQGQTLGWVQVIVSLEGLADLRRRIWIEALVTALQAALFALLLIVLIVRRPSRTLEKAAAFAASLARQEGATLATSCPILELTQLQQSLNEASRTLDTRHRELQDSEARKGAILSASLDCLITIDAKGEIVDFNLAAETTFGYQRDEVIGRSLSEVIVPPAFRAAHERGMRHYLQTGEGPVLNKRIELPALRRDGSEFPVELSIVPFLSGGQNYFLGSLRDITERKALETERARVNSLLKESLKELEYQKYALDQHSIVSIADASGVITYANDKFSHISGYSLPELIGKNHRLVSSGLHPRTFFNEMWATISSGQVWHGQIANRSKQGDIYWVASTIVPWLDDAGLPYQYVSIRTDITAEKRNELALAEARRRELETGSEIQRALLLGDIPEGVHGADLATYTEPSQGIDGDFFAITTFGSDCFEVLVGDVMGKGVPAALIGAAVKSTYNQVLAELFATRATSQQRPAPNEIIDALHQILTPRLINLNAFVTLALYRFDVAAGTLTFVNAGHTPGLLARTNGKHIESVSGDNLPIGVLLDEVYTQETVAIQPGDALLVFSDGITEARCEQRGDFGMARLENILQAGHAIALPPTSLLQSIRQQVRSHVGSDLMLDDQTIVMVQMQPRPEPPRSGIECRTNPQVLILPWQLDALGNMRMNIAAAAHQLRTEETDALILASFEAATNILRHAKPHFSDATLACRLTQTHEAFVVELIYPGPIFAPPPDPQPDFSGNSDGGFGLFIMESCVDRTEYVELIEGISCIRLTKRNSSLAPPGSCP